jgi:hypothetical protein
VSVSLGAGEWTNLPFSSHVLIGAACGGCACPCQELVVKASRRIRIVHRVGKLVIGLCLSARALIRHLDYQTADFRE